MQNGNIVRLMDKGFGFIKYEGSDKDLFFHASELVEGTNFDELKEGDAVTFELTEGDKGPQATQVARADA